MAQDRYKEKSYLIFSFADSALKRFIITVVANVSFTVY